MIIDKLTLHNFGIYKGQHEIALTPKSATKPITLFGGLNGGGKTTFLDALLLSLWGKFAKCSNRGQSSYEEYLRRCINRHVNPTDGAAVELAFRHRHSGTEEAIRVNRTWRPTGKGLRENVTVYRNGKVDPVASERWYEFIEDLIPARIANLFFFDGEKIEHMATAEEAAELVRTGIYALLGLDLVNTLRSDLQVIERRNKAKLGTSKDQEKFRRLEEEQTELGQRLDEIAQKKASQQTLLDRLNKEHQDLTKRYRDQGGALFDQRDSIMAEHERVSRELMTAQDKMRDIAAGDAPLLLVEDLLEAAYQQTVLESESAANKQSLRVLESRDQALVELLGSLNISAPKSEAIAKHLEEDRRSRSDAILTEEIVGIETEAFAILHGDQLNNRRQEIGDLLAHVDRLEENLAEHDRKLAMIPDPEGLVGISEDLTNNEKSRLIAEHRIADLGSEEDQLRGAFERKDAEISRLAEKHIQAEFGQEKFKKIISAAADMRTLLADYNTRMVLKHIDRLEHLILSCYQTLLRKDSFISRITIAPESFRVTLFDQTQSEVPLDRLSAGERQLLAISILWGLSKASGRALPTVIDTPLGRLDGSHRQNLIDTYFPAASHQVILLSTDKEVDEEYYRSLQKHVGNEYSINFNDFEQSSQIVGGYFWRGAA